MSLDTPPAVFHTPAVKAFLQQRRSPADGDVVVLFDGVCNLCTGTVRFILRRDPAHLFRFAPLQSDAGRSLLAAHALPPENLDTIVVIDGDACYFKSDAALHIVRQLGGFWPVLGVLRVIPRSLRHAVYDFVARHRARWFGTRQECMLPAPADRDRFLG